MEPGKLSFKMEWKFKGVTPESAKKELDRIEKKYGKITPFFIIEAAKPKDSLLHDCFEWDNDQAAHQFRLRQARQLIANIEVSIISDGKERKIRAYEIVHRPDGNQYKNISLLTPEDADTVKVKAVREINYWKSKLAAYKQFDKIVEQLEVIISQIEQSSSREIAA